MGLEHQGWSHQRVVRGGSRNAPSNHLTGAILYDVKLSIQSSWTGRNAEKPEGSIYIEHSPNCVCAFVVNNSRHGGGGEKRVWTTGRQGGGSRSHRPAPGQLREL